MKFSRICLVVIFNHRYDENIVKLKKIYEHRFSQSMFLVPFYDGKQENVIPVYECSFQFPGFLIQAYDRLMRVGADYYLFVADDLILSPNITEENILKELRMEGKGIFITGLSRLNMKGKFAWPHARFSSSPFMKKHQTRWEESLPEYQTAMERFYNFFGTEYEEEYGKDFFECDFCADNPQKRYEEISCFLQRNGNSFKIPYPMAMGYSDIFMLKREKLYMVARLCGIFSAMNLFAEISFPTAVVLSAERKEVGFLADTEYVADVRWEEDREEIGKRHHYALRSLYDEWEDKNLYIHPVKLSKWSVL